MGIYGAMSTAVTGLRAQSFALENISGNIANSQTTGFKRIDTDFMDLIPDAPQKRQTAGSVLAQSRSTNNIQGDVKSASTETYMAINGNGPVRVSSYADAQLKAKNPVAAVEAKVLADARGAFPPFPEAARAQATFLEEVQLAVIGRKPVKDAVAAIVERVKPMMPA